MANNLSDTMEHQHITSVAHEVGNLLQIISGCAQFSARHVPEDPLVLDYLSKIEHSVEEAATLLKSLLPCDSTEAFLSDAEKHLPIPFESVAEEISCPKQTCCGTVLIADDEEFSRDITSFLLQEEGYRTHIAKNGQEAIDLFHKYQKTIDLLLFDVEMHKCNGRDAYRAIEKLSPGIPVIMCTGYESGHAYQGIQTEHDWILRKPFQRAQLLNAVRQAMPDRLCQ